MAKRKYKKATPWNKIKADYLTGITPKELGEKYNMKPKAISDKANEEGWVKQKSKIAEKVRISVEEEIKNGSTEAVAYLRSVINDSNEETKDRISAAKGILEVSGLKSSKQEINGRVDVEKIYVSAEELKETNGHIDKFIEG